MTSQFFGIGLVTGAAGILQFLLVIALVLVPVVAFWKICAKAGFPAALGLLMLVPVANLILPLYLAFADWPALTDKNSNANG